MTNTAYQMLGAAYVFAFIAWMSSCTDCYGVQRRAARNAVREMVKQECRR